MTDSVPPANTPANAPSLAMVGLGRMGANMARRLAAHGAVVHGHDPSDLQRSRGWTPDDWAAADAALTDRGLLAGTALTEDGRELRAHVEATTDQLASAPLAVWSDDDAAAVIDALDPVARAVSAADILRYPNPIGLPPLT